MQSIRLKGFGKRECCGMTAQPAIPIRLKGFGKRELCGMSTKVLS
jgi:hypothetical protein